MSEKEMSELRRSLCAGLVIPACPLALDAQRCLDERHQRALVRYYAAAGAGGLAVGVHTTQFAIHNPQVGLYRPVLELAAETLRAEKQEHGAGRRTWWGIRRKPYTRRSGYGAGIRLRPAQPGRLSRSQRRRILTHCRAVARGHPSFWASTCNRP